MLKLTLHNTTQPVPKDPLPIAELSLEIDPPIPESGQCEAFPFLRVQVTTWSGCGDATTCDLAFPLLGPGWPEVTATLTKEGKQAPNLFVESPSGHKITVPSESKAASKSKDCRRCRPPNPPGIRPLSRAVLS